MPSFLRDDVPAFVEEHVGPVGSRVRVEIQSLAFKRSKRTSLKLLEVVYRGDRIEEMVFAPGPRRQAALKKLANGDPTE